MVMSNDLLDEEQLKKKLRSTKRYSSFLFEISKILDKSLSDKEKVEMISAMSQLAMESLCPICLLDENEEHPTNVKGLCKKHYYQHRKQFVKTERKYASTCSIPGCEEEHSAKGYCKLHYSRVFRQGLNPLDLDAMLAPKRTYGKTKE